VVCRSLVVARSITAITGTREIAWRVNFLSKTFHPTEGETVSAPKQKANSYRTSIPNSVCCNRIKEIINQSLHRKYEYKRTVVLFQRKPNTLQRTAYIEIHIYLKIEQMI
jgi:hypothetical protein